MLYYRSTSGGKNISLRAARAAALTALAAYPAGALLSEFGPSRWSHLAGLGLVLVSLIGVAVLMSSSLQRIVGEKIELLDEYELKLRNRAMSASYTAFTVLALLAVIYAAIAADAGWWVPSEYGDFNGLFWGIFLYASILPSVFLTWQMDPSDMAEGAR